MLNYGLYYVLCIMAYGYMYYGLRITFNDRAFFEDQKAEPKATSLAKISEL